MSCKPTVETSDKVAEVTTQLKESMNIPDENDTLENASKNKKKNKKKKSNVTEENSNEKANGKDTENKQASDTSEQKQAEDEAEKDDIGGSEEAKKKRKRNRNKNKKKAEGSNSEGAKQTDPPTLPVSQLFPDGNFPIGEIMDHHIAKDDRKAADRFSSEESRAIDRAQLDMYNEIRQAAEAHRQTRQHIQKWVKPGMKMIDICNELESTARKLINENGLKVRISFQSEMR